MLNKIIDLGRLKSRNIYREKVKAPALIKKSLRNSNSIFSSLFLQKSVSIKFEIRRVFKKAITKTTKFDETLSAYGNPIFDRSFEKFPNEEISKFEALLAKNEKT